MALCPGLPRRAGTRKVKPIWILQKQESVWQCHLLGHMQVCTRQITMPAPPPLKIVTDQMPFVPPNQQHQSTEGSSNVINIIIFLPWVAYDPKG